MLKCGKCGCRDWVDDIPHDYGSSWLDWGVKTDPMEGGPPTLHESVTQEAHRLVYGGRASDYGHPADDFAVIASFWSTILAVEVTAEDVPVMMVALKLARAMKANEDGTWHRDTWVDVAGYAQTAERLHRRTEGLE